MARATPPHAPASTRSSRLRVPRHDLDPLALIAGVGFGGLGVVALIDQATGLSPRWTWPVLLILVGVVGLLVSRRGTDG